MDNWNVVENPEIDKCICGQLISRNSLHVIQCKKGALLNTVLLEQLGVL